MHLSSKLSSNDEQRVKGSNPSFKVTKNRFLKEYERQTQKKEKTQTQSYSAFLIFDYLICIYLFFVHCVECVLTSHLNHLILPKSS